MSVIANEHHPGILEKNQDLETQASFIKGPALSDTSAQRIFFTPAGDLISKGWKKSLTQDEVWRLDEENTAERIWGKLQPVWEEEQKKPKPSLFRAVLTIFKRPLLGALGVMFAYGAFSFINPIILPFLILYVNDFNVPTYAGFIYIFCIIISQIAGSVFYYYGTFRANIMGMNMRTALLLLVYRKSLTIAPAKDSSSGQVVNLISSDALFIADSISLVTLGVVVPLQLIIGIILLAIYINFYVVIVVGLMILSFPITAVLGRRFGSLRLALQLQGDKRLKLINELLAGIRIVKYYAWEDAFFNNIDKYRELELNELKTLSNNRAILLALLQNVISVALGITIILWGLYENFNQSIVFTVISIFSLIRQAFLLLPITVAVMPQYINAFNRVQTFIAQPDILPVEKSESSLTEIRLEDASFQWPSGTEPVLKNINMRAKKGDLVMIVGPVGSGKSSYIQSVLGELPKVSGSLTVGGDIAYVAQEAFIFNSTVRENIIFGKPFDMDKYRKVLETSALMPDLYQFTAGDSTEIGERGVNLSGGQKQRISIARALYSDADIILLDDPLSAVDAHVGKHLFEKAIKDYWKEKLVILATNQLQYLPYADNIIFLSDGEVVASGKFDELMASTAAFKDQMGKYGVTGAKVEEKQEEIKEVAKPVAAAAAEKAGPEQSGTLINDEEKQTGLIGWNVYWYYFTKGNAGVFALVAIFFAISVGSRVTGTWWLTEWTTGGAQSGVVTTLPVYAGVYAAFIGGEVLFNTLAYFIGVTHNIKASRKLHQDLLAKVIRAPTAFYDVTPLGRIVNRFAKELDLIDQLLPIQLISYVAVIVNMLGIFASLALGSPYMLIAVAALIVGYYFFQWYYRKTYIEVQRLEAVSRAPIFSQLGETLRGASTIRAYKMQSVFKNVNSYSIDANSQARYAQKFVLSWFGLRLDLLGNALCLVLFILIVSLRVASPATLAGGFAALALSNTSGLTGLLSNLSINSAETEAKMNSIERIREYDSLEQEAPAVIPENRPPKDWPATGEIIFKDTSLRYRQGDLVLKRLNLTVKGEEKVGIVGRTGAGKSTLLQALFRIVELAEGSIEIDGIDISSIGLRDLRSKIAIIPQDPVLFLGTVRYNIDPFNEHSDVELWEALNMINLKTYIESLDGQLDAPVEENGSNFSVGQRQLMCMARALLRKTKILVMDEATASVDLDTDMMIQSMVRRNFSDRTTLTIAHRLNTVMDSTKVLVLNRGELSEYDKPASLLDANGIFASMVEATGPQQSEHLKKIARGEIGVVQSLQSIKEEESSSEISEEVINALKKSKPAAEPVVNKDLEPKSKPAEDKKVEFAAEQSSSSSSSKSSSSSDEDDSSSSVSSKS